MPTTIPSDTEASVLNRLWFRYLVAVAAPVAGLLLSEAVARRLGQELPAYIMFYPAVVLVAVLAGLWPGVLATVVSALLAAYFILPPKGQFAIASPADALSLAIFVSMGLVISAVAELYQRSRQKLAEYEKERALREKNAALRASEERWEITLQSIGDAVLATDASAKITFLNPLAESLLECARSEAVGRPVDEVFRAVSEQTGLSMESPIAKAIHLNQVIALGNHAVLLGSKGARTPIADTAAPIRDASGAMIGAVLVFRDVSERRVRERERAQALLQEQVQRQIAEDTAGRLRKIESVTEAALAQLPLDKMLQQLLRRAAEALKADMAEILLLNEQTRMLEPGTSLGFDIDREAPRIPLGQGIAGTIAKTGQLRIIENLAEAEVFNPRLREKAASLIGVSLMVEDRMLGVLHVDSRKPRKFTEAEANLLQVVADRVALAIDRKRTVEHLAHVASFPELNPQPIFETDLEGKVTYANPSARRLFPDLVIGGTKHPALADWARLTAGFKLGVERTIVREIETEGRVFHQTIHYPPQLRLIRAYLADITERKRVEEALRASEERWATTLQSIGDAVISTCAQGKVVFMNDVAQRLTGWSLAEAQGRELGTVFDIVQEVTRIRPENPVAKVLRLGKVVGLANHTALIRRDGTEINIEDSGAPIRNREGEVEGVVLVFHDVSAQRRMEKVLRDTERLATTGRLAATIAHEIHNPLDAVGNLLYLVERDTKEEATRQHAALANQELARVGQITHQMLTFQRDSAKPVPVRISEILENVLALYERKIGAGAIRVEKEIEFEGEILARPGELRQVFANLVGNAIEAMEGGHGKLRVRAYASRDWRNGRSGLRVVIADNGRGIPADLRETIFDPFFTTKGESGTGLGLWITTGIVSKYQGTLRLRSTTRAGRSGTCFSVLLPFERPPEATAGA